MNFVIGKYYLRRSFGKNSLKEYYEIRIMNKNVHIKKKNYRNK